MKATYWSIFLVASLFLAACGNQPTPGTSPETEEEKMHREHTNPADNLAHKGIIILEEQYQPNREFGYQIVTFFGSYLSLEEAFVKSDTVAANNAAREMKFLLDLIPEPASGDKAAEAWANHKEGYRKNLTEFLHVQDLEEKRSYFSHITEFLYCTFKSFDMEAGDIHVAYCPMAFDNKGAYWLTDDHKIRNPYFGDKMLKCGEITEIIP
ncbi:MAG: DUF3347 domain-containing protein [Saprospiraceae bacterium]